MDKKPGVSGQQSTKGFTEGSMNHLGVGLHREDFL